ncbi:MAG: hypothetical protein HYX92_02250 [Chloroflexi bacterium]|nr:hypothetical protein [Chloroflexota bacterium]
MNIYDRVPNTGDENHSFVIRMWREGPEGWRGRIRHVQTEAQLGFTKLGQAVEFMQRHIAAAPQAAKPERAGPRLSLPAWLLRPRLAPALVSAAALVALVALLLGQGPEAAPPTGSVLVGTAAGGGLPWREVMLFLLGMGAGGGAVAIWLRRKE